MVYTTLARRFPGKTGVEIMETVFGPYLGKVIAALFIWFTFHLGSMVIRNFTDFFTTVTMPETPSIVFAAALILVSAFAVHNGLEVITRCSLVLVPLAVLLLSIIFVLQLNQINFENFLPLFETPWRELLKISHSVAVFPFGDGVVFLMVLPFLNQIKEGRSRTMSGIFLAMLYVMLASLRNTGALGAAKSIFSYPAYEAVKLINLPFVNTRLEIIVVLNFLTMGFLKITVLHYCAVLGLGQIFRLRSMGPLIIPIGILMVVFSIINFSNFTENTEFNLTANLIYCLFFQLGIPLLTLAIAIIRKLPSRNTGC